eukprot:8321764-Pyramimonas_sp.AAC.1
MLCYGERVDFIRSKTHGMPGEDGSPYCARRVLDVSRALYDVYLLLFSQVVSERPMATRGSSMVLLTNGVEEDASSSVTRGPQHTRPLNMSNAGINILAGAITIPIRENTKSCIVPVQKCAQGRDMASNIIEAEAWGLEHHILGRVNACLFPAGFLLSVSIARYAVAAARAVP